MQIFLSLLSFHSDQLFYYSFIVSVCSSSFDSLFVFFLFILPLQFSHPHLLLLCTCKHYSHTHFLILIFVVEIFFGRENAALSSFWVASLEISVVKQQEIFGRNRGFCLAVLNFWFCFLKNYFWEKNTQGLPNFELTELLSELMLFSGTSL